jgi:hypothetical protein
MLIAFLAAAWERVTRWAGAPAAVPVPVRVRRVRPRRPPAD